MTSKTLSTSSALLLLFAFSSCGSSHSKSSDAGTGAGGKGGATGVGGQAGTNAGGRGGGSAGASGSTGTGGAGGIAGAISGLGGDGAGGDTAGTSGSSAGRGGAGGDTAGTGGGSAGRGGAASVACPANVPAAGSPCSMAVGRCTWGTEPLLVCRTSGNCTSTGWALTPPPAYCAAGATCTSSTVGGTCNDTSLVCVSGNATSLCSCVPCNCMAPHPPGPPCAECPTGQPLGAPAWFCRGALTPSSPCPSIVPNAGAACDTPGMACPQSACQDTIAVCTNGVWQWTQSNLCPVCASPDTPIATPFGERPIAELRVGDLVYSVDDGAIVPVPLVSVGQTPVAHHQVVRVVFGDGRSLEISAGHPTADGRTFGDLRAGGQLDRHEITSVEVVPYPYSFTYDVLPKSTTGTYFAGGALVGSTLHTRRGHHP